MNLDRWASTDRAQNGNLNATTAATRRAGSSVPGRLRGTQGRQPPRSTSTTTSRRTGIRPTTSYVERHQRRGQGLQRERGCDLVDVRPPAPRVPFPSDPSLGRARSPGRRRAPARRDEHDWGGTITSISRPVHSGSVNGNSSADIWWFRSTGSAVLLAWAAPAQSRYWDTAAGGARDGASLVSGAPGTCGRSSSMQWQQEPGPQHPAERHRGRVATPGPRADPTTDARAASGPGADPATTVEPGSAERADRSEPGCPRPRAAWHGATHEHDCGAPGGPERRIVLVYVAVLTLGLVGLSVHAARRTRASSPSGLNRIASPQSGRRPIPYHLPPDRHAVVVRGGPLRCAR